MSAVAWEMYPKDVFRWVSFGTSSAPTSATVKRPHWQAYGLSAFNDVFVWGARGASVTPPAPVTPGGSGGLITFQAWQGIDQAEVDRIRLEKALERKQQKLRAVEKKIRVAEKKAEVVAKPAGILANLDSLRTQASDLRRDIEVTWVDLSAVKDFLNELTFEDDDEDEWMLFQ